MYLSMSIIDDDHVLDRILESMNLDKYELIGLTIEQLEDSSHKHTDNGMDPTSDMGSTGLAPHKGSSMELLSGVDPCQESSLFSPLPPTNR